MGESMDVTASPDPIIADSQTSGRTYRVVRGNNQPDEILAYDWHATFAVTFTFNGEANDSDVDVDFPVRVSAATVTAKQAQNHLPEVSGHQSLSVACPDEAVVRACLASVPVEIWCCH